MALEGQQSIVAHHAATIVGHLDQLLAARFHLHADPRRARIQRVLQQLLQHRRRTLHHLARGDLVGNMLGKYVDSGHDFLFRAPVAGAPVCMLLCAERR